MYLKDIVYFFADIPRPIVNMIKSKSLNPSKPPILTKHKNKKRFEQFIDNKRNVLLVLPRYDHGLSRSVVDIIDLNNFEVIHTYKHDIAEMNNQVTNTKEFSRLSAKEYIEEVLVKKLHAKKVIIGYDHRFGRNRNANIEDLRKYGKEYGFEVEEISKQDVDEVAVSSTKIRKALQEGNIEKANSYLGSHFLLTGKIVKGKGIGKDLGFPTANLKIEEAYKLIPKTGVYVVKAEIDNEEVFGMMNIGYNPTVGGSEKTIETYFFNLDKNLYGKQLQIKMLKRIREEKKFSGLEELIKAMKKDEEFSINYINQLKS